jgi:hypothetical protein
MPELELVDYDTFDYKHFDEPVLSLEEATRRARGLRSSDPDRIHRIVPVDPKMTGFRVESHSAEKVYAEFLTRWSALLNKFAIRFRER